MIRNSVTEYLHLFKDMHNFKVSYFHSPLFVANLLFLNEATEVKIVGDIKSIHSI